MARVGDMVIALDSFLTHTPAPTLSLTHSLTPGPVYTHWCPLTLICTLIHPSARTWAPSSLLHSLTHSRTHRPLCQMHPKSPDNKYTRSLQ